MHGRIRNDECEYSHGRARNKAVGENVGELFVRRALAQKSMTKSVRFMGATGREGRDGAELRTRRYGATDRGSNNEDSARRALIAASAITPDEVSRFNNLEETIALNRRRERGTGGKKMIYGDGYIRQKR